MGCCGSKRAANAVSEKAVSYPSASHPAGADQLGVDAACHSSVRTSRTSSSLRAQNNCVENSAEAEREASSPIPADDAVVQGTALLEAMPHSEDLAASVTVSPSPRPPSLEHADAPLSHGNAASLSTPITSSSQSSVAPPSSAHGPSQMATPTSVTNSQEGEVEAALDVASEHAEFLSHAPDEGIAVVREPFGDDANGEDDSEDGTGETQTRKTRGVDEHALNVDSSQECSEDVVVDTGEDEGSTDMVESSSAHRIFSSSPDDASSSPVESQGHTPEDGGESDVVPQCVVANDDSSQHPSHARPFPSRRPLLQAPVVTPEFNDAEPPSCVDSVRTPREDARCSHDTHALHHSYDCVPPSDDRQRAYTDVTVRRALRSVSARPSSKKRRRVPAPVFFPVEDVRSGRSSPAPSSPSVPASQLSWPTARASAGGGPSPARPLRARHPSSAVTLTDEDLDAREVDATDKRAARGSRCTFLTEPFGTHVRRRKVTYLQEMWYLKPRNQGSSAE